MVVVCVCAYAAAAASRFYIQSMSWAEAHYQALSLLVSMCDYKNAYRARIDESSYLLNCVHDLLFHIRLISGTPKECLKCFYNIEYVFATIVSTTLECGLHLEVQNNNASQ